MADVKLPLVGDVSKKTLMIGGVASVAVVGFIWLRKRKTPAPAPAAATDTTGTTDPNAIDPNTGLPYSQETSGAYTSPGYQDTGYGPTYGSSGYYDPNTGQWIYGNTGTILGQATTNPGWAQQVEQYLIQNNGTDPVALSAALGAYLTGQAVTSTQESLIEQAIAIGGYPPQGGLNGYPPGIRTQPDGHGGGNVVVPNVVGQNAGKAHNTLVNAGLHPVADPGQHPSDKVTSTTPKAGETVAKGSEVLITAQGTQGHPGQQVQVPHVTGDTAGQAHNVLTHAGLVPTAPKGQHASQRVHSTTPPEGTEVPHGSRVRINT